MSETKKVSKKQKMKKSNMRKTIIMAVLCVVLLSSATYAWFVLSDTAKISNLSLTVTEASGLLIAPAVKDSSDNLEPGTYGSELNLTGLTGTGKLKPATLAKAAADTNYTIMKPQYTDGKIDDYLAVATDEVMTDTVNTGEYYYYEKSFFMTTAGSDLEVQFVKDGTSVTDATDGGPVANPACDAIRIAFFDKDGKLLKVYEPNSEKDWGTTRKDKVAASNITVSGKDLFNSGLGDVQQKSDKTFVNTGVGTNSETLFTLTQNDDTLITMRVYFEGNDNECCNIISANKILGNMQFKAVTTSP